jgi:pimeloyl-ACP methyl ester carboxylesterase
MDAASFHAQRRFANVESGRIAYIDKGSGPPALFIHGVPLNGFHWRFVIEELQVQRTCIAPDLMGLGYTQIGAGPHDGFNRRLLELEVATTMALGTLAALGIWLRLLGLVAEFLKLGL